MLINQELSLIDKEILNKNFYKNRIIINFLNDISSNNAIHLVGLVSDGGVHSHMTHLYALLRIIKERDFEGEVFIHAITDGRDTAPQSALQYFFELEREIEKIGINAKIASVSGRYYAMDRDNHWDRTKKAYQVMSEPHGILGKSFEDVIKQSYNEKNTDEFIRPSSISLSSQNFFMGLFNKENMRTSGCVIPNDRVIFFNIRPDRMRQIVEMFLFPRNDMMTKPVKGIKVMTLSTYNEFLPVEVAYKSKKYGHPIAKIISDQGLKQGHFAETEKYAHVTYFFDGGHPKPYPGEIWDLVPSPNVATYDLKPEMSANEITAEVFKTLRRKKLDFVLINYANSDMVGHTGSFDKVIRGIETIDEQLSKFRKQFEGKCPIIITADHGNAECMIHPQTGEIDKRHTVNPVPFILVDKNFKKKHLAEENLQPMGILADVAPTALALMGIKGDFHMTGVNLLDSLR